MNGEQEPDKAAMLAQLEAQRDEVFEQWEWHQAHAAILDRGVTNLELEDKILRAERKWAMLAITIAHWQGVPVAYGQPN